MSDMSGDWSDEYDSWNSDSLPSGSDSDCSLEHNQYHRLRVPRTNHPNNGRDGNPQLESPSTAARRASRTASTGSTTSDLLFSYTTRAESGISSVSPRTAAAAQPRVALSELPTNPILVQFASRSTSTRYLESSDSEGTGSGSIRSNILDEYDSADTPDTSEADSDDENFFGPDEAPPALNLNGESLLAGLEFPKEYRHTPSSAGASSESESESDGDGLEEIIEVQTRHDARPWVPIADTFTRVPDPVENALAPSPGSAYNAFHSPMRHYTRHDETCHKVKVIMVSFPGRASSIGSPCAVSTGNYKSNQHIPLPGQSLGNGINSRRIRLPTLQNTIANLDLFRGDLTSQSCRVADAVINSINFQASFFHPDFLVSHLSAASVSTFAAELCKTNSLFHTQEYAIELSLGFGPDISFHVFLFVPECKEALRSFRKREGSDKLDVQDSLPIALDLLSIESTAETIDKWLDGIVNSRFELLKYLNLMMKRYKRNLSVEILQAVVSWFLETRSKLLDSSHKILRIALKLLLTTSILEMVPKVTSLTPFLSADLSLDPFSFAADSPAASRVAPKLLTRQIKASTYHLQQKLLHALFYHFMNPNEEIAQARLSVALTVSFVLELVRNAGRQFAKYANTVKKSVFVEKQQVQDYERNIDSIVFERIRASVYNSPADTENRMGELGDRLRSLKSIMKGKGKESEDCRFVSAILAPVL